MTEMTAYGWEQHAEACRKALLKGDAGAAERAFAAALAEAEAVGSDSPALAACLVVLAQIRSQQRDHSAAEMLFRRALDIRERAAEFDHTAIIQILGHLATIHNARAEYDAADALLTRALALADKYLPPSHPAVASLLSNLARLYFKRADHAKADRMLVRLLQIKQALGTEHPEVAGVLASIAALRSALGKHDVAEQLWRRVLAIREKALPHNDPALITTLNNLADSCASQGEHEEALHFRERALRLQAHALGSDHPEVADTRTKMVSSRDGTPARPHTPIVAPEPIETMAPSASVTVPTVATPAPVPPPLAPIPAEPPQGAQQSRITPIPVAAIPKGIVEPFSPGAGGGFAPFAPPPPPGLSGVAPGIGGPPLAPGAIVPGIGGPMPTPSGVVPGILPALGVPESDSPASPIEPPHAWAAAESAAPPTSRTPAPAPVASAPRPSQDAIAPPLRRSEPSVERPRYEGYDKGSPAARRGGFGKVLVGVAVAAGIGFAALKLLPARNVAPAQEARLDTVAAEPRIIRIPAESLRVPTSESATRGSPPAITLDSALAASRARNALDTASTLGVAADSVMRPIVVPSARTLDALSRAVDAGIKPMVDSAVRAPALKAPTFRSP